METKEFLQWCKEEKDKGNKLVMGRDMVVHSVPKRKTLFFFLRRNEKKKLKIESTESNRSIPFIFEENV